MRQLPTDPTNRRIGVDEHIERCVQFALRGATPSRSHDERRRLKRHPFPYPVRLTPVNTKNEPTGDAVVVLGKHLTNQGLDFYYQKPIAARRVIALFDCDASEKVELLVDLTWCRFGSHGWYENGGRFLAAINAQPTDQPVIPILNTVPVTATPNVMNA